MEEGEICSFSDVSELFLGEIIKNCEPFPERMTNRPMQWYWTRRGQRTEKGSFFI